MFRNITIGQLSIFLTLFVAAVNGVILLVLYINGEGAAISFNSWIIIFGLSLVLTFIIVKFFLEYFVFRKIKVIYKLIEESRIRKQLTDSDIEIKSIKDVNDEVEEWAKKQEKEFNYLRKLEVYRRNFVGNISHELKTPLFAVQGYLMTLIEGAIYDDKINMKYLRKAINNADRLQNIVDDLETINQFEADKIALSMDNFEITALCHEVIDDLKFLAADKGTILDLKDKKTKLYRVVADKEKIRHVFYNLLSNAIKYGNKNGEVKIEIDDLDSKILISIADTGIGIAEEHLKHLFDRFYRVEQSRNRREGGSGLGLSIVKHILEAHNQSISVKSKLGEGSVFSFTLGKS